MVQLLKQQNQLLLVILPLSQLAMTLYMMLLLLILLLQAKDITHQNQDLAH